MLMPFMGLSHMSGISCCVGIASNSLERNVENMTSVVSFGREDDETTTTPMMADHISIISLMVRKPTNEADLGCPVNRGSQSGQNHPRLLIASSLLR